MQNILAVGYEVVLPVFLIIGLVAMLHRWLAIEPKVLSRLVVYLFSPFLVIDSLSQSNITTHEIGAIASMAVLSTIALLLLGWLINKTLPIEEDLKHVVTMCIVMANTGNLGYPLIDFAFGKAGGERAILFFVLVSLITNSLGIYLSSRGKQSARESLANIFKVPLVYATILGLWINLSGISLPLPVARMTGLLADATVPSALALLGLQLAQVRISENFKLVLFTSGVRLLIAPLIGFALVTALGISELAQKVSIMQISMPTALFAAVFALQFGGKKEAKFATSVILITTICGMLTLSILLSLLQ